MLDKDSTLDRIDWASNIAFIALEIEKQYHDRYILCDLDRGFVGMEDNYRLLKRLFQRASALIPVKAEYTEEDALLISALIHEILLEEGFKYRDYSSEEYCLLGNTVFGYQLAQKEIDCVTYCILGLGIAEHLNLPMAGIYMPGHLALRWMLKDRQTFNLELSIPAQCDDDYYMSWKDISPEARRSGIYLRNLAKHEVLAQQYYNLSLIWEKRGELEKAVRAASQALQLFHCFPDGFNLRGIIMKAHGMMSEALHDFDMALALDDRFMEARNNRERALEKARRQ
jgi:regulator of sirC expression with transglutaminase-like and TPR domain